MLFASRIVELAVLTMAVIACSPCAAWSNTAQRLKDINPGAASSNDFVQFLHYAGEYYFLANDGDHGEEIWKTDGTPGGTRMVVDLVSGGSSSNSLLLAANCTGLFFTASHPDYGRELWRTKGTPESTEIVFDSGAGNIVSLVLEEFAATDDLFFFRGHQTNDLLGLPDLWVSDGTPDGGRLLFSVAAGGTFPQHGAPLNRLAATHDALYLRSSRRFGGSVTGVELGRVDGIADVGLGIPIVADISPGPSNSNPDHITPFGNKVFFSATSPGFGREPWMSDGTEAGTSTVFDAAPGTASSNPDVFFGSGPYMYFGAQNATFDRVLWRTDGTTGGTVQLSLLLDGTELLYPNYLTGDGGDLYFSANTRDNPHRTVWKTDGTLEGTRLFAVVDPRDVFITQVEAAGSYAAISGFIFNENGTIDSKLWISDGTPQGTKVAYEMLGATERAILDSLTWTGSRLLFYAPSGVDDQGRPIDGELWYVAIPEPQSLVLVIVAAFAPLLSRSRGTG